MTNITTALEAIGLFQTQCEHINQLWGYFSVVSLTIVGFIIGRDKATIKINETITIVTAYLVFCLANLTALSYGQSQLNRFYTIIKNVSSNSGIELSDILQPIDTKIVVIFHLSITLSVVAGILLVSRIRNKSYKK